jgi:hypothetical protein
MHGLFRSTRRSRIWALSLTALAVIVQIWAWEVRKANLVSQWRGEEKIQVAYEEGTEGQILLPVSADGIDVGPCMLDSGAEAKMILITPDSAHRADLKTYKLLPWSRIHGSMGGSSGLVPTRTATEFRVGPIVIRRARLAELAELSDKKRRVSGQPIGSVCSSAIFHAAVVDIDWRAKQIVFYEPGDLPTDLEKLNWIPVVEDRSLPYVKIRLDGGQEGLFLIDTGMTSAIHFHKHAVEEFDLLSSRVSGWAQRIGIGGSGMVRLGELGSVSLGQYRIGPVTAAFDTSHRYGRDKKIAGRIGRNLLRHFRTIIDLPNKRVALVAYSAELENR